MDIKKWSVHATHCCEVHGCKYGDEDCPVVQGSIAQKYACMDNSVNNPCFNEFKKHTGFNTHAEFAAYEKGREDEGKVIENFLRDWKGETNSEFGSLLKKKFESLYPHVGIGIMIFKDGKVLMGKRKGKHGAGEYAWPGGHLEYMETIEECAKREVEEETGMEICNIRLLRLMSLAEYPPVHFVDIGLIAEWKSGEPVLKEPDACEGWDWYDIDNLPRPFFASIQSYLDAYKNLNTNGMSYLV